MAIITIATGLTDQAIDPALPDAYLANLNALLAAGLAAEPADATGPDRGQLTRWFGYVFGGYVPGKPRMTRAEAEAILPLTPGDPNPFFEALDSATQDGLVIERGKLPTDPATLRGVTRDLWLSLSHLALLVSAGGECLWEVGVDSTDRMYHWLRCDTTEQQDEWPGAPVLDKDDVPWCQIVSGGLPSPASVVVGYYLAGRSIRTNQEHMANRPVSEPV